jgi:hypothetical protein
MTLSPEQVQQGVRELTALLDRGYLSAVDLTCQGVFAGDCRPPEILLIAAKVAIAIGEHAVAQRYLDEIESCSPQLPGLSRALAEMDRLTSQLTRNPPLKLLLHTDDTRILSSYAAAFPDRLIATNSLRSSIGGGVHYLASSSRRQPGLDVMIDMYLATECDYFLGMGSSNGSNWILHLKYWPPGTAGAVGPMAHYQRNVSLHIR